jgi:hypothetical protein
VEAKVGDEVSRGDPLLRLRWNEELRLTAALAFAGNAVIVEDGPARVPDLIMAVRR